MHVNAVMSRSMANNDIDACCRCSCKGCGSCSCSCVNVCADVDKFNEVMVMYVRICAKPPHLKSEVGTYLKSRPGSGLSRFHDAQQCNVQRATAGNPQATVKSAACNKVDISSKAFANANKPKLCPRRTNYPNTHTHPHTHTHTHTLTP